MSEVQVAIWTGKWHLKWGQSHGAEPLTCGIWCCPWRTILEWSGIVGHPAGVWRIVGCVENLTGTQTQMYNVEVGDQNHYKWFYNDKSGHAELSNSILSCSICIASAYHLHLNTQANKVAPIPMVECQCRPRCSGLAAANKFLAQSDTQHFPLQCIVQISSHGPYIPKGPGRVILP